MLSQTSEYALRAVVHLAESTEGVPVRVDDIAESLGVPKNYLSKILHTLTRAGILASARGPRGGFRLEVDPARLSLASVVGEFGPLTPESGCLLGRARCSDSDPCAAHERWKEVSATVSRFFGETMIADLTQA